MVRIAVAILIAVPTFCTKALNVDADTTVGSILAVRKSAYTVASIILT